MNINYKKIVKLRERLLKEAEVEFKKILVTNDVDKTLQIHKLVEMRLQSLILAQIPLQGEILTQIDGEIGEKQSLLDSKKRS